jgi:hypothetical protein
MEHYNEVYLGHKDDCAVFTIAFAFPKEGPLVVKGSLKEVQDYIWKSVSVCHYKITYWDKDRKVNECWYVNDPTWNIIRFVGEDESRRYLFTKNNEEQFRIRNIPKHFIKELTNKQT